MADSNITKKALAMALKDLMRETPFEKITITDICEKCDMNRKSFYYHFKDKYDLVVWIFDTEFMTVALKMEYKNSWDKIESICNYFYVNHSFYSKIMNVTGQNSLQEHIRELLQPILEGIFCEEFLNPKMRDFQIDFFSDALVIAFQRWLKDKNPMPPEEFIEQSKICLQLIRTKLSELEQTKRP